MIMSSSPVRSEQNSLLQWEQLPDMPLGVFDAAISRRGDAVVITGGMMQTATAGDLVQVFDLNTLEWSTPIRLGVGRCMHAQITLPDGRILLAGGYTGQLPGRLQPIDDCVLIDLDAGRVETIAPLPSPTAMPTAHLLPDGRVMVIGGNTASIFNPRVNDWDQFIQLRQSRKGHASTLLADGRVFVAGGMHCKTFEIIDPNTDGVASKNKGVSRMLRARLPMPVDDLELVLLPDQRVWIIGGQSCQNGDTTDRSWLVDLSDPEFSQLQEGPRLGIAGGMADHCVAEIGSWIVVAGGESQQKRQDTELNLARLLDARTLSVWALPPLGQPHDDAVSIATPQGLIIFGGYQVKSMTFPRVQIGAKISKKQLALPGVRVPFAGATVERLTLPNVGDPQGERRPRDHQQQAGAARHPFHHDALKPDIDAVNPWSSASIRPD